MLKTYTTEELKKILEDHRKYIVGDFRGSRADLNRANLIRADLSRAYLRGADLSGAYLIGANISGADLSRADLSGAYLTGANLRGADLTGADLSGAYLTGADLSAADLTGADLSGAYLRGADLSDANLSGANLSRADLSGANHLNQIKGADVSTMGFWPACPPEGDVIGWKKAQGGVLVKLLIPKDAKRSSATTRKCRAEFAEVLQVIGGDNQTARSIRDSAFVYRIGEVVKPTQAFNEDRWSECSTGIHFFITREEAQAYNG